MFLYYAKKIVQPPHVLVPPVCACAITGSYLLTTYTSANGARLLHSQLLESVLIDDVF